MKATFVKGAVLGAAVAMITLVGSAAVAGTGVGKVFDLGESNRVNARSQLEGATVSAVLNVTNSDKSSVASGVSIDVPGNDPPLVVNSATKVKNLNADLLDGRGASQFQGATSRSCPNNTAIRSIAPNGATACTGSAVLPIAVNLAPGASTGTIAFGPSSLGLSYACIDNEDITLAQLVVLNLGSTPATVNWDDIVNAMLPEENDIILTPPSGHPNDGIAFAGDPQAMMQLEFFDATTVTTINVSLLKVLVGGTFEGCEFQGTVTIAAR